MFFWRASSLLVVYIAFNVPAVLAQDAGVANMAKVIEKEGRVTVSKAGARTQAAILEMALTTNDRLRTYELSRAVLEMSPEWFARIDERTDVEIIGSSNRSNSVYSINLLLGNALINSREQKGDPTVKTPSLDVAPHGTEFAIHVDGNGKTLIKVFEGEVSMSNEKGALTLEAGQSGGAARGEVPHRTAEIETRDIIQWALYYPAVVAPEDLELSADEKQQLGPSLEKYTEGDLLAALDHYPTGNSSKSGPVCIYHAAVLLSVGRVAEARSILAGAPEESQGRRAIERMLKAVAEPRVQAPVFPIESASCGLAESYFQQAMHNLPGALNAARRSTELAPSCGYAWTRLADLEFSFGHTNRAIKALDKGLKWTPRNAEAWALKGFLSTAQNEIDPARDDFLRAIDIDGALGDAWLGLGLTSIRRGDTATGLKYIQVATTVEPTRSLFTGYHGRVLSSLYNSGLAKNELELAHRLDPADPNPLLFLALNDAQGNNLNDAIMHLEASSDRNVNRSVYRSNALLNQDQAVRSANLASIYLDNGMSDLALREATRGVDADILNASAHLFLADSYDALRDPQLISLRYEDAWFNERLLANLLAPVGGGSLSQFVSQQEYSKLLTGDGLTGDLVSDLRSGYSDVRLSLNYTMGMVENSLDIHSNRDDGYRPDNGSAITEVYWNFKYQFSGSDMLYTMLQGQKQTSADTTQTYSNLSANEGADYNDKQSPGLLLVGWDHIWDSGSRTLFLGGRLSVDDTLTQPNVGIGLLVRGPSSLEPGFIEAGPDGSTIYSSPSLQNAQSPGPVSNAGPSSPAVFSQAFLGAVEPYLDGGAISEVSKNYFDSAMSQRFTIYSFEMEHIWKTSLNTAIGGWRIQDGTFDSSAMLTLVDPLQNVPVYSNPADGQTISKGFNRESIYFYDYFDVSRWLTLIAGASWDRMVRPDDFRIAPFSNLEQRDERRNGKAGFTFSPSRWITIRGAYTEALGGVSFDGDVQLEPVQFAGFTQDFRTVISESIVGSVVAPVYHSKGLSAEGMLSPQTWWVASFNLLDESVSRTVGVFDVLEAPVFPLGAVVLPANTAESLAYKEGVFTLGLNQLLGREIAFGAEYKATRAELADTFPGIPLTIDPGAFSSSDDLLQEVRLNFNWNAEAGWFAACDADHYKQDLVGPNGGQVGPGDPGDSFWQVDGEIGHRFHHNMRKVSLGVLDLTNRDFRLSPLTYYSPDLPHSRTFFVRFRVSF